MVFSGIPFLYFFLPALLLVYFILPDKLKNPVLLLVSLIFYASGEPKNIIIMIVTIVLAYVSALAISALTGRKRQFIFIISLILSILPLFYFKYADFIIENISLISGIQIGKTGAVLPIGISFYTFQVVGYLVDVYRNKCGASRNLLDLSLYVSLFPQLIAGPIVRYTDVEKELKHREHSLDLFYSGVMRFSVGLFKKVLVANVLGELCNAVGVSMLGAWVYALSASLQIYYDFSGYSDMAIGLGKIFGFTFPENFNYPYISSSISEFWRRWHISLGSWFRDYVYIPLGGNRVSFIKWIRNVLVVWMLTGLWHGAEWTFVLWGLYFAIFLVIEKVGKKFFDKCPLVLRHLYVILAVILSFVLFNSNSVGDFVVRLKNMFDLSNLTDISSVYYLKSYALTLIIGVIGSTPFIKWITEHTNDKIKSVLSPIVCASVIIVSTSYIIGGSYNPFLYFRF